MKLNAAESTRLLAALIEAFPNRGVLTILLAAPPVGRQYARLVRAGTLDEEYFQLVQAANEEGWIGVLFEALRAAANVNPALLHAIDGFIGLRSSSAVLPHLELLLDGTPFVNQHGLREALLTMTRPNGPKVLQVTGERASGRSYSQYLIAHVARHSGAEIYLAPPIEATTTAREVIEDIALFLELGTPQMAPDAPQDTTEIKRLVRWLAAAGRKLDRDWWLVFDGFDSDRIGDGVLMLMHGLAHTIGLGQPARMRLFLLAWDRPISGPPPGRVYEQGVLAFSRDHVKEYFDALIQQFRMPPGFASTDEILTVCYEGADAVADPFERATVLTKRIQKVAEAAIAAKTEG